MSSITKTWAFVRRDFRNDISYRFSFLLEISNIVLTLASFYFLSKLLGERLASGYAPFPFLLIGMAVNGYMTTSLYCFSQGVRSSQQVGAIKAIFAAKVSPTGFVAYSAAYPIFRAMLDAAVFILGGVLFGLSLRNVNVLSAAAVFFLSVAAFGSIGILSAAFAVVFKKGDPLLWFFGGLSWLLGGVFYPLEVLPIALRQMAQLLPITHALSGMRKAVLEGASVAVLAPELRALLLFSLIGLPVSIYLFRAGMRWVRNSGSLGHF